MVVNFKIAIFLILGKGKEWRQLLSQLFCNYLQKDHILEVDIENQKVKVTHNRDEGN